MRKKGLMPRRIGGKTPRVLALMLSAAMVLAGCGATSDISVLAENDLLEVGTVSGNEVVPEESETDGTEGEEAETPDGSVSDNDAGDGTESGDDQNGGTVSGNEIPSGGTVSGNEIPEDEEEEGDIEFAWKNTVYNESNASYHYFYKQLKPEAQRIYQAMEEMYEQGIFATGASYDLSENGKVLLSQMQSFANGDSALLDAYGAARDAFQYDFPDVFYVNWDQLTLRVTQDAEGTMHAYLGAGRSDTYLLKGFSANNIKDAVTAYEKRIANILKAMPDGNEQAKTEWIHDYLTTHMVYHFEYEVENEFCSARTAYDGLIYGEGVCEAYTRSFKALMDRAGIPTVCVYGVYKVSETAAEQHIWNNVLINGTWYGVDVTQDDPRIKASDVSINGQKVDPNARLSGKETQQYLLVGSFGLATHHYPSGIMSPAMYEFTYPELTYDGIGEVKTFYDDDLVVKLKQDTYTDDQGSLKSGSICVSYKGKNYTQNAAEGKYIISRYGQYYPNNDTWFYSDWAYITPEYYDVAGEGMEPSSADPTMLPEGVKAGQDGYGEGNYVYLPMPHIMRAQFAVTDVAPTFAYDPTKPPAEAITGSLYYEGDPDFLTVISPEIENEWGTYVKPPYPVIGGLSYAMNMTYKIPGTFHFVVPFDDKLVPDKEGAVPGIEFKQMSRMASANLTGLEHSKLENFQFDGESTISFDFTPSEYWADDCSIYIFSITGLVGEKSGKKPIDFEYGFQFKSSYCSLGWLEGGFHWRTFGSPVLLDAADLNLDGWGGIDPETGEPMDIPPAITDRMFLVAEKMSPAREKELTDILDDEEPDMKVLATQIYNLDLTLCKCQIVTTGEAIRVCIGWPEGYDYSKIGEVTFKAYHYVVDKKTNKPTGEIEPITCIATEYGLIIECRSFSPFLVAAVDPETVEADTTVKAIFQASESGAFYDEAGKKLTGITGIIDMDDSMTGENAKKITVKANDGYVITSVRIGSKVIQMEEGATEYEFDLDYADADGASFLISAEFISKAVQDGEADEGNVNGDNGEAEVPEIPDDEDLGTGNGGNTEDQDPDSGNGDNSGEGEGEGSGDGEGEGEGSGDGEDEGSGDNEGDGEGEGSGDGEDEGDGSGDGEGSGDNEGDGEGEGSGDNEGDGEGSGDGEGDGSNNEGEGSGDGEGSDNEGEGSGDGEGDGSDNKGDGNGSDNKGDGSGDGKGNGSGNGNGSNTGNGSGNGTGNGTTNGSNNGTGNSSNSNKNNSTGNNSSNSNKNNSSGNNSTNNSTSSTSTRNDGSSSSNAGSSSTTGSSTTANNSETVKTGQGIGFVFGLLGIAMLSGGGYFFLTQTGKGRKIFDKLRKRLAGK